MAKNLYGKELKEALWLDDTIASMHYNEVKTESGMHYYVVSSLYLGGNGEKRIHVMVTRHDNTGFAECKSAEEDGMTPEDVKFFKDKMEEFFNETYKPKDNVSKVYTLLANETTEGNNIASVILVTLDRQEAVDKLAQMRAKALEPENYWGHYIQKHGMNEDWTDEAYTFEIWFESGYALNHFYLNIEEHELQMF